MTDTIDVAVIGASGRMGSTTCAAVENAPDLRLVGRFGSGTALERLGGARVAVDFSVPHASADIVSHCVDSGVNVVVGTTGWDAERLAKLEAQLAERDSVGVLIAPNFAIGALLMMSFARQAAPFYESVEIVETHHPGKVDAPSGTARRTAALIAGARRTAGLDAPPDATRSDPDRARGAEVDGVRIHAQRLRGRVAHQQVNFGAEGEALTIRHDSFDRDGFMPGVLAGIRGVVHRPGLTVGLEHYLDLA